MQLNKRENENENLKKKGANIMVWREYPQKQNYIWTIKKKTSGNFFFCLWERTLINWIIDVAFDGQSVLIFLVYSMIGVIDQFT